MKLGLHQSARMEQRLVQSPQMIQAMQILQLSALDLEERVEQELVENPFLEEAEATPEPAEETHGQVDEGRGEGYENMLDVLERYERDFGDGSRRVARAEDGDAKFEALSNAPDEPQSMSEVLVAELAVTGLDDRGRRLAEYLAYSLDERGYLDDDLDSIARQTSLPGETPVRAEELESALDRLRSVSHPGLGARDLRECLLLQVEALPFEDPLLETLVRHHLEDIQANRLPRIVKATGADLEEVKDAIESIRHLEPTPGARFGDARATTIAPDVVVERVDGEYQVRLVRARTSGLSLSRSYRDLLSQAEGDKKVQEWIKKRVDSARWFIDAVHQRESTLLRVARVIFVHQQGFLDEGVSKLKPLRMQEVADELEVHISTVSRAVAGKYAQTPRGIFSLKSFFTGGTAKKSGEVTSQTSIKQRIKELVEGEDSAKPFSDEELAKELERRDGIKIARRTVTKYRKALSIPASSQRKQF